ncbi:restriction endonuclease subunit S [Bradyrhizobium diazoefficiens]|uniref:restriction endonuclease subunit S n=1 Tax=Bradyrhizobium diazoefficiens TaxID=1355477 RepID=UPI0015B6FE45|nr:restriction endonuclease subunit S [Bradyrhizobium diazoefficiens]QLD43492.1 restriction endonuclease subunit S [Bradyrhizobium diazoefficiens]
MKQIATFTGGGTPSRENLAFWNGDIPWVSPKDMKGEEVLQSEECITVSGLQSSATEIVPSGTVLLVVRSGILKHTIPVAINRVPVALNQDMKAIRLSEEVCLSSFFQRWVQGLNDSLLLEWSKQGATVDSIEHAYLAATSIPLPPLPEQEAICDFLDHETDKIDALIEGQSRLIELLQEKRQALISQAVTKGLNSNVRMKSSGVDWLGEVPEHWEVTQLRRVAREGTSITYGIVQAGPDIEGGIPYIRASDMAGDQLPSDGYLRTSPEIDAAYARSKVSAGDLVIAIRATIGKPLIIPSFLDGANLTQGTAKFSPGPSVLAEFFFYFLRSSPAMGQFERLGKGATFKEITLEMLRKFQVLRPPLDEQRQIADLLNSKTAQLDRLISEAERAIALLQERRVGLISAAVTGKIDVRGFVKAATAVPDVVAA